MEKIKEKLKGSSSNDKHSNDYSSSNEGASHLQHPISSGTTDNTSSAYGSSRDPTYGSTGAARDGYANQPGGYSSSNPGDSYNTGSATANRMPGSFEPREEGRHTTSSTHGAQKPMDPFSKSGQQTAADSTSSRYEDPSVDRSRQGGVLNQTQEQQYSSGSHHTGSNAPYSSQPASQHHNVRDAALATGGVGAAGAGGYGAYEMGGSQDPNHGHTQGSHSGHHHDASHMDRSAGGRQYDPGMQASSGGPMIASGGAAQEPEGLSQAKKAAGAYEAGYRDAMEHMKAEGHNPK